MKILNKLIRLHKFIFSVAVLITILSVFINLWWNKYLADMLDRLGNAKAHNWGEAGASLFEMVMLGIFIIVFYAISECLSFYLAAYTCETIALELGM